MILLLLLLGFGIALVATIVPSATNLLVLKKATGGSLFKVMFVAYGAALGETIVAGFAISFGFLVKKLYQDYLWIQIAFVVLMLLAGILLILKKTSSQTSEDEAHQNFGTGFLLGFINIPMFIFWVAVLSSISSYVFIGKNSPWSVILSFLSGVLIGKVVMLYVYARLSDFFSNKFSNLENKMNIVIGIVLITAAIFQSIKLITS